MSQALTKHIFSESNWIEVQSFDCGDSHFEKEVADWLKASGDPGVDSALNSIRHPDKPSRVWLYRIDQDLVGFGALARSEWRWPGKNNDPKLPLSVIIFWVGIQKQFQGQPPGPRETRYAAQILDDLVAEAQLDAKTHPVLGLFVHKDNARAIRFYKQSGFSDELVQRADKTGFYKMFIVLDDDALLQFLSRAGEGV
jgi:ribosomal protein S18 acetylase RimI-like enzyme